MSKETGKEGPKGVDKIVERFSRHTGKEGRDYRRDHQEARGQILSSGASAAEKRRALKEINDIRGGGK
jgi:hypothetical protein